MWSTFSEAAETDEVVQHLVSKAAPASSDDLNCTELNEGTSNET